jgi:hypothetical protein
METGRLLVRRSKSQERGVVVKATEKGEADRRARPSDAVVLSGINEGRFWRFFAAKTVGDNDRGMTRQIRENQLSIGRRRNNDYVYTLEQLRRGLGHRTSFWRTLLVVVSNRCSGPRGTGPNLRSSRRHPDRRSPA